MKELVIKQINAKHVRKMVYVDDKPVVFSKVKNGVCEGSVKTDKESVKLTVYTFTELASPLWWLFSMLFYIISIFGLFDPVKFKSAVMIDYLATLDLTQENPRINLKTNYVKEGNRAIELSGNVAVLEEVNAYYLDAEIKKRIKSLKILKIAVFILFIILLLLKLSTLA